MVDYYEHPALNQSKLKLLAINPELFNTVQEPGLFFEEKKHFVLGGVVDCMLTTPQEFTERYHVSYVENKPTDVLKSIAHRVYTEALEQREVGVITSYESLILEACVEEDYQPRWKDETKYAKVCEGIWEYFEDLKASRGKQVLSAEEHGLASAIVMSIRTNEATSKYFEPSVDKEIRFQFPIYFVYEGVDCKALLDMVVINHKEKTIQPIDIKTLGDYTINFPKSVRQRRYDIQAAFYTEALEIHSPDYKVLPFKFIVESTIAPGVPLVYTCDGTLLHIGKYGRSVQYVATFEEDDRLPESKKRINYSGRLEEIKGFHDLIELYKYYTLNGFDVDQRVRENNSHLTIDWSGIIV